MSLPKRLLLSLTALVCGTSLAQQIPPDVAAALERAKVPLDAVTLLVVDAEGRTPARLSHRTQVPVNPASVMKLVTTYAGLDLLGPAYTWQTPVFVDGAVRDGTLFGNLIIKGLGIDKIAGDIVLDRSAFEPLEADPAGFDGEPLRPYNATPDALLLNFKSVVMTFVPDRTANTAQVYFEPPLAGVQMQTTVPLSPGNGAQGTLASNAACGDYRSTLKADFSDPARIRFGGSYPLSCFEKVWPVAYADPANYSLRAVEGLWRAMGGQLGGKVRAGVPAPATALAPVFEMSSPALAEVIRDINKFSNNVMAQQLFLSLSLPARSANSAANGTPAMQGTALPASREASRAVLNRWWKDRISPLDAPTMDNGSGLSRSERISAQALARMLQTAYRSPLMPELMSSLPIAGVDGTLKRSKAATRGSAHLKTGSLRDVTALAGYVHGASGKRYVLVAIANHANANAVRPAFDALVEWTVRD